MNRTKKQLSAKHFAWSEAEDRLILKLRREGASAAEAAAKLGRDVRAVYRRYGRLGASLSADERCARARASWTAVKTWSSDDDALLLRLRDEGLTGTELAARLGLSRASVVGRLATLRRLGDIKSSDPSLDKTRKSRAVEQSAGRQRSLASEFARRGIAAVARDPWTPQNDQLLADLRNSGLTVDQIAHELGRSRYSVAARASRLVRLGQLEPLLSQPPRRKLSSAAKPLGELSSGSWSAAQDAELLRLRAEKATRAEAALALGRTQAAVIHRLSKLKGQGK